MLALHRLQQNFARAMLADHENDLHSEIARGEITPEMRLRIYRNNILSSMIAASGELFPAVKKLVGDDFFDAMARDFILQQPPKSGRLGEYGNTFPDFLRGFEPARQVPYLGDVAEVELAWLRAYRSPEAEPLDAIALASMPPENMPRMTFELHPSAILMTTGFPAGQIWQRCQADDSAGTELGDGPDHLMIIRPEGEVQVHVLSAAGFEFLTALHAGTSLVDAFEAASAIDQEFNLEQSLIEFLTGKTFTSFAVPPA
ncbi:MAG: DUF2063 domain-containing protein [Alphaproteobacteria bacterium]